MDRRRRPLGLLIAALAAVGGVAAAASEHRLEVLTWIAGGHEAAALTRQPATCPAGRADDPDLAAGRALFNAPQLFGGQAARAGLSCASCHSNGRSNPHFFLAGLSDQPGTADVTASFFGVLRGNGRFDPKPIPDLALPGRVSRDRQSGQLERFTRDLIVEEFSGREPSGRALAKLGAYVRAIRPCAGGAEVPQTMSDDLGLVRDSVRAAARFADEGEPGTAAVLVGAARTQLGRIDERLAPGRHPEARAILLEASRRLQRIRTSGPDSRRLLALDQWFTRTAWSAIRAAEEGSLYRPGPVARWLLRDQTGARTR